MESSWWPPAAPAHKQPLWFWYSSRIGTRIETGASMTHEQQQETFYGGKEKANKQRNQEDDWTKFLLANQSSSLSTCLIHLCSCGHASCFPGCRSGPSSTEGCRLKKIRSFQPETTSVLLLFLLRSHVWTKRTNIFNHSVASRHPRITLQQKNVIAI